MFHYFISEAEGVCGASEPGYVAAYSYWVWSVMSGLAGFMSIVSGMTVGVMSCGAPP